jgi:NADP-dependent 3-hydroxy acid dehydrogenase YdfG
MTDFIDLTGKSVIVTGASSGIGESTARLLHAAGAYPVLAARRADRHQRIDGLVNNAGASLSGPMVVQSPDYATSFVLRLLRTGEERFDIPHGQEQPGLAAVSGSA